MSGGNPQTKAPETPVSKGAPRLNTHKISPEHSNRHNPKTLIYSPGSLEHESFYREV